MQSVKNIFQMSQEDPASTHVTKYTMQMKPSAFGNSKHKTNEKYKCYVVCKNMRKATYTLKVVMSWEAGTVIKSRTESDVMGSFSNTYEFKVPITFKRFPYITQNFLFEVIDVESQQIVGWTRYTFSSSQKQTDFLVEQALEQDETPEEVGQLQMFFSKCEKVSRDYISIEMEGKGLKNVDGDTPGDKSDPFLIFKKPVSNQLYIPAHITEAQLDTLDPKWEKVFTSLDEICDKNMDSPIKIECWDWQEDLRYQFIGEVVTTINKLFAKPTLTLVARDGKTKTGDIKVKVCQRMVKPDVQDFLTTEDKFSFVLGVDFSEYNCIPYSKKNLHELDRRDSSLYLKAIQEISKIMWSKDSDGKIPCFGFGGRPAFPEYRTDDVTQVIPMSGNKHKMSITSPEKLVEAYKNSIKYIDNMAPCCISDILKLVRDWAIRDRKDNVYYVLVILTSGRIDDLQKSIDLLVEIANLPISIIFVGLGSGDFSTLEKLDGDKKWLRGSNKKLIERDIVNFVDFEECFEDPERFSRKLLEEFPQQFMSYKLIGNDKKKHATAP